jgi:hypothetical protein
MFKTPFAHNILLVLLPLTETVHCIPAQTDVCYAVHVAFPVVFIFVVRIISCCNALPSKSYQTFPKTNEYREQAIPSLILSQM